MRNSRCLLTLFIPFLLINCTSDKDKNQLVSTAESIVIAESLDTISASINENDTIISDANINSTNDESTTEVKVKQISDRDRIENEQFRIAELKRRESLRSGKSISEITLADIGEKPKVKIEKAKFEKVYQPKEVVSQAPKKKVIEKKPEPIIQKPKIKSKPVVAVAPKPVIQEKKGNPRITFETMQYNFDTLTEGDVINYSFKFKNTGDASFEVLSAQASCGCTRPSFPFLAIDPGQEGVIGVTYDSRTKSGEQTPKIEVQTDFQDAPITLLINGYVKEKPKVRVEEEPKDEKEVIPNTKEEKEEADSQEASVIDPDGDQN